MQPNERLILAIQKKGRLSDDSLNLLKRCGLTLLSSKSSLFYSAENFPMDVLLVRDDDIPVLVRDQVCDLGIVGENVLSEHETAFKKNTLERIKNLGFGRCRLTLAIPKEVSYSDFSYFEGKRIATSYPNLLGSYLTKNQIQAEIIEISGSVEITPRLGMAEAICDLVSTGRTLGENNLKEVVTVLESQAVLVKTQNLSASKNEILTVLLRRIEGVLQAQESKYILFHAPKAAMETIQKLLPGSEIPTVLTLIGSEEKVAVHVVSRETVFWGTLEKLREAGASSILVMPVEKMMM
ncbi:MAG: ATP phosphoribosyltransferase [Candidatus Berkiellales bacterium]